MKGRTSGSVDAPVMTEEEALALIQAKKLELDRLSAALALREKAIAEFTAQLGQADSAVVKAKFAREVHNERAFAISLLSALSDGTQRSLELAQGANLPAQALQPGKARLDAFREKQAHFAEELRKDHEAYALWTNEELEQNSTNRLRAKIAVIVGIGRFDATCTDSLNALANHIDSQKDANGKLTSQFKAVLKQAEDFTTNLETVAQDKIAELANNFVKASAKEFTLSAKEKFVRAITIVGLAFIGFALGLTVGGLIGFGMGSFAGPFAVFSAFAGMLAGAVTGATIASTLTGVAFAGAAAGTSAAFFARRQSPLQQAVSNVANRINPSVETSILDSAPIAGVRNAASFVSANVSAVASRASLFALDLREKARAKVGLGASAQPGLKKA